MTTEMPIFWCHLKKQGNATAYSERKGADALHCWVRNDVWLVLPWSWKVSVANTRL